MIDPDSLTQTWLDQTSARLRSCDKILLEKSIRALVLVEQLKRVGLPFIFKGGSALMLYQALPRRFSIDIDILLSEVNEAELRAFLLKIAPEQPGESTPLHGFTHHTWQPRRSASAIHKAHVKFFYQSIAPGRIREAYILLDVLFEANPYAQVNTLEINSDLITYQADEQHPISVPSLDDLMGDKLTAFAPNTTGIPYGVGKELEIMKQLYDLGVIFSEVKDIASVSTAFQAIVSDQIRYRGLAAVSWQDVCRDIIQTALCLCTRGKQGTGDFDALQLGVKRLTNHIWEDRFHIEAAITTGAQVAYVAALLLAGEATFERFQTPQQILELDIKPPAMNRLNKLRKTDPEAFFYWHLVSELVR